jgi:hypothetical protein
VALSLLIAREQTVELRILMGRKRVASGYFRDLQKLVEAAGQYDGRVKGIYITANPCKPELLARANEHMIDDPEVTTADHDIARRTVLVLDFDPIRPAGIASTDVEHAAAIAVARRARTWLIRRGVPADGIALLSSGNGAYLLISVRLVNDDVSRDLCQVVLIAVDMVFRDNVVKLDLATFNASRIVRLVGTSNQKGDELDTRRYRRAELLEASPAFTTSTVPAAVLEQIAVLVPPPPPKSERRRGAGGTALDLATWLNERADQVQVAEVGQWKDTTRYRLESCVFDPNHRSPDAALFQFASGALAYVCLHDSCREKTWRDVRDLLEPGWRDQSRSQARSARDQARSHEGPSADAEDSGPRYSMTEAGTYWLKPLGEIDVPVLLANVSAVITANVTLDDGAGPGSARQVYEIAATVNGRTATGSVPAVQFPALGWIAEFLGSDAMVLPGLALKDHLRYAIQRLSVGKTVRRTVYGHTGWRKFGEAWLYLSSAGALGRDGLESGIDVSLPADLEALHIAAAPSDPAAVRDAVRASLQILDLAPDRVTVLVLAATYRACMRPTSYSVGIVGATNNGKTELAALAQQHFGRAWSVEHLPGNWLSTANSAGELQFLLKDALQTFDDFSPEGSRFDIQHQHGQFANVLRRQGNRSARKRMQKDLTVTPAKPPRGCVLWTGETLPRGPSLTARSPVVELAKDALDFTKLTACQADAAAGRYVEALAACIQWLAPRYDEIQAGWRDRVVALRSQVPAAHRKTATIIADLACGWQTALWFMVDCGALTREAGEALWQRGFRALCQVGGDQTEYLTAADPVTRILTLLRSAVATGKAHLASCNNEAPLDAAAGAFGWTLHAVGTGEFKREEWRANGDCIGWLPDDEPGVYLDPDAAFMLAQQLADAEGDGLPISLLLWKRQMHQRGMLASTEESGGKTYLEVRRTIAGSRSRVLHLRIEAWNQENLAPTQIPLGEAGATDQSGALQAESGVLDDTSPPSEPSGKSGMQQPQEEAHIQQKVGLVGQNDDQTDLNRAGDGQLAQKPETEKSEVGQPEPLINKPNLESGQRGQQNAGDVSSQRSAIHPKFPDPDGTPTVTKPGLWPRFYFLGDRLRFPEVTTPDGVHVRAGEQRWRAFYQAGRTTLKMVQAVITMIEPLYHAKRQQL